MGLTDNCRVWVIVIQVVEHAVFLTAWEHQIIIVDYEWVSNEQLTDMR